MKKTNGIKNANAMHISESTRISDKTDLITNGFIVKYGDFACFEQV